ncbi:MAG: cobalt ECF transporter T component CbiQ [Candidatus Methanoperedens sp.]|nr:cobalt ECF transporter T component CbiQ [Candidatus Methanoperedens sp.]MCE8425298.1 cobalt ECF transporter T component CbiQ [Candidatus Methanoperedens sp.]MCE8427819.1 cobalt ECF transporter T component CbiQ [Candidatus Methanoperedens sp.]
MKIPDWLSDGTTCPCCAVSVGGKRNFVEKTLVEIASMMERSIFSEKYSSSKGFLQSIDPRVKLITILLLIVTTSFVTKIEIILGIYVFTLFFAYLSKVDLFFFIKRVWLFIPIFSGIVVFPAMFNVVTPGEPLVTLVHFNSTVQLWIFQFTEISITKEGALGALLFISRVAASVSLIVLLTLTTRWADIMKSLRTLGVPQIFVMVLSMTYQYIFLLVRVVQEMHLAKKSRTIKTDRTGEGIKKEQNWVASRIGTVLMKSYKMSDEIHSAMISRGFHDEIKSHETFRIRNIDRIWTGFSLAFITGVILLNYPV